MGDNIWFLRWLLKYMLAPEGADVAIVATDGRTFEHIQEDWGVEYTRGGGCFWATFRDTSSNDYEVSSIHLRRCVTASTPCDASAFWVIAVTYWSGLRKRADQILYGRIRFCLESPMPEEITS